MGRFDVADVVRRNAVEAVGVTVHARKVRGSLCCIGLPGRKHATVVRDKDAVTHDP